MPSLSPHMDPLKKFAHLLLTPHADGHCLAKLCGNVTSLDSCCRCGCCSASTGGFGIREPL